MAEIPKDSLSSDSGRNDRETEPNGPPAEGRVKRPQLSLRPRLRSRLHRLRRAPRRARH